eukprot:TRINITY_DN756_c1_g1_i2.p1 TRINITY_DN756_c1_g1~~TRINITY_DN756_c1_g1_i2.p1  ORF type:complete len:282 (-),score=40.51 TRINITY_DN756_c1_g1_i2:81-926(-)
MNSTTTTQKARSISSVVLVREQSEGVGARVKRSIGSRGLHRIDPFLMLDEATLRAPAGFPAHPHRGFETVTYMLEGSMTHEDSKGHKGTIGPGDLQWMTAGRGIVHSEMPASEGVSHGLQLWINLAAADKMVEPQYQELLSKDIPVVTQEDGVSVRVIAGTSCGVSAAVRTRTPTMFLDVTMQKDAEFTQAVPAEYNGFAYILSGAGTFGLESIEGRTSACLVLGSGDSLTIKATSSDAPLRFVLIAGKPIGEPIVQHGPFVMNTQEEIAQAFRDYQLGLF